MDKTVFNEHLLDLKKQVIKVELRINSYTPDDANLGDKDTYLEYLNETRRYYLTA